MNLNYEYINSIYIPERLGLFHSHVPLLPPSPDDDGDVYLDKLQTRGVKKSILYM
jgi:glycyl-tRNA synthetase alpha subunit